LGDEPPGLQSRRDGLRSALLLSPLAIVCRWAASTTRGWRAQPAFTARGQRLGSMLRRCCAPSARAH